jgi:hypothetical protein
MALIRVSLKHGQPLDEAIGQLDRAVGDLNARFSALIEQIHWSENGRRVNVVGKGFDLELRVDEQHVHAQGNIALLNKLLASPLSVAIKSILKRSFPESNRLKS